MAIGLLAIAPLEPAEADLIADSAEDLLPTYTIEANVVNGDKQLGQVELYRRRPSRRIRVSGPRGIALLWIAEGPAANSPKSL